MEGLSVAIVLVILAILAVIFGLLKHYVDNGYYIPASKEFAFRRYSLIRDARTQKAVCEQMKAICKETLNGQLLSSYPFFHGDHSSLANRVVCLVYDRKAPDRPVAFHAAFNSKISGYWVLHGGLLLVKPEYQRRGIQTLMILNLTLRGIFKPWSVITEIASSPSFLSVQEKCLRDCYPDWRQPRALPRQWQLDIVRSMMASHRAQFGCSKFATLDEETLVVRGSNAKVGGGAYELIATYDSRKSKDSVKQAFLENRLCISDGDEQFYIGRIAWLKVVKCLVLGK